MKIQIFLHLASNRVNVMQASAVSVIVGIALTVINQWNNMVLGFKVV